MKYRWLIVAALVAFTLLLFASCSLTSSTRRSTNQPLSGRMLLWHSLNSSETEALNQVISSFTELNPDVSVKVQVFSTTVELNEQFINAATTGFGPDLILAPSSWIKPLVAFKLIAPMDDQLSESVTSQFGADILAMHQIDGKTYGLPQSLDTQALYVNRLLVETPANSFSGLIEQANAGTTVLIPINFVDAFWGIQAFGGQLFNETGQAILDQGGFVNWLAWLRDARNAPGMIQDTNRDALRQRFIAGNAGYYVGYASELNEILRALDPANVTVLSLPIGPVGPAGGFIKSQAFLLSNVSSDNQHLLAAELAKFITNAEQSSRLMRLVRHVPANTSVRINPRLYPIVAAFANQVRSAIPMPARPEFDAVVRLGNEAYVRTLEGSQSPAEVAFAVNNSINEANGFAAQNTPTYTCNGLGTIILAHSWQQPDALAALDQIIENFKRVCPLIIVETLPLTAQELPVKFGLVNESGYRPNIGLVSQNQLASMLIPEPLVKNANNILSADILQRFAPIGIEAMTTQGSLYGVPFVLEVDVLYYNQKLVATPAQTLDDLRLQSMLGVPITLDTNFEAAFWGLRAFGTQIFDANGAVLLDQGGMAEWLSWLVESRDNFDIKLSSASDEILRSFLAGESAYYVAGANALMTLRETLGDDLRVALLPSGPAGPAQPLTRVHGFVLRTGITDTTQNLMLEFIRFATDTESQTLMMNNANKVPINANVSTADEPYFAIFVAQAQSGFLLPNTPFWQPVVELGEAAYLDVLEVGLDPNEVVRELASVINRTNGVIVTPQPTPTPTAENLSDSPTTIDSDESTSDAATGEGETTPTPDGTVKQ